jgi:hypothetical protein
MNANTEEDLYEAKTYLKGQGWVNLQVAKTDGGYDVRGEGHPLFPRGYHFRYYRLLRTSPRLLPRFYFTPRPRTEWENENIAAASVRRTLHESVLNLCHECGENDRWRRGVLVGHVDVDSGHVEFSLDGKLDGIGKLVERVDRLTLRTARSGFDGKRGFVRTGWGDGRVPVVVCRDFVGGPPRWRKTDMAGILRLPRSAEKMVLGDCGRIQLEIPLKKQGIFASFHWEGQRLWIVL